jgi:hypothetical protein
MNKGETMTPELIKWRRIAESLNSLEEERAENWQNFVTKPCETHKLTPRQARAILEFAAHVYNLDVPMKEILDAIIASYFFHQR